MGEKICSRCGAVCNDSESFCRICGGTVFSESSDYGENTIYFSDSSFVTADGDYSYVGQNNKKTGSGKKALIITLAAVIPLIIAVVLILVFTSSGSKKIKDGEYTYHGFDVLTYAYDRNTFRRAYVNSPMISVYLNSSGEKGTMDYNNGIYGDIKATDDKIIVSNYETYITDNQKYDLLFQEKNSRFCETADRTVYTGYEDYLINNNLKFDEKLDRDDLETNLSVTEYDYSGEWDYVTVEVKLGKLKNCKIIYTTKYGSEKWQVEAEGKYEYNGDIIELNINDYKSYYDDESANVSTENSFRSNGEVFLLYCDENNNVFYGVAQYSGKNTHDPGVDVAPVIADEYDEMHAGEEEGAYSQTETTTQKPAEPVTEKPTQTQTPEYDDDEYFLNRLSIERDMGGESYLDTLSRDEIQALINSILAHNGYEFKDEELRAYFSQMPYYNPKYDTHEETMKHFSKLEKENFNYLAEYRNENYPSN